MRGEEEIYMVSKKFIGIKKEMFEELQTMFDFDVEDIRIKRHWTESENEKNTIEYLIHVVMEINVDVTEIKYGLNLEKYLKENKWDIIDIIKL